MIEHSKGFRTGRLTKISQRDVFLDGDTEVPFVALLMTSEFPIGFGEVAKEDTNVLVIGSSAVHWWETMLPRPKVGDTLQVSFSTMYVGKNGALCMRTQDPASIVVIPQSQSEKAPGLDTYQVINAKDFFTEVFRERKEKFLRGE